MSTQDSSPHTICWKSRRQQLTALSTTEAELNALSDAAKEASWLRTMLTEMKLLPFDYRVRIHEDNSGCLALVNGKRTPARTKHQAVRIGYVRDLIANGAITVTPCSTADMIADPLTKPLGFIDFERKFRDILFISQPPRSSEGECKNSKEA